MDFEEGKFLLSLPLWRQILGNFSKLCSNFQVNAFEKETDIAICPSCSL